MDLLFGSAQGSRQEMPFCTGGGEPQASSHMLQVDGCTLVLVFAGSLALKALAY